MKSSILLLICLLIPSAVLAQETTQESEIGTPTQSVLPLPPETSRPEASPPPPAGKRTFQTLFTCEEDDGDQYYRVGITTDRRRPGVAVSFIVVRHDDIQDTDTLVVSVPVTKHLRVRNSTIQIFEDASSTARLEVSRNRGGSGLNGDLSVLAEGPRSRSIKRPHLDCFRKSDIQVDL